MNKPLAWSWIGAIVSLAVLQYGCRAEPPLRPPRPPGRTVVLLDFTDPPASEQRAVLLGRLRVFAEALDPGEQLSVWVLGDDRNQLRRIFHGAVPARRVNPVWANPLRTRLRAESTFSAPLRTAVQQATLASSAKWSPILESIRELAELDDFSPGESPRRLLLVSDLEQRTPERSVGQQPGIVQRLDVPAALESDLRGVAVNVLFIPRGRALADEIALKTAWREYFRSSGAGSTRFERL